MSQSQTCVGSSGAVLLQRDLQRAYGKSVSCTQVTAQVPVNDYTPFLLNKDRKEAGLDLRQPLHLPKELQHRSVGKEQLFSATKRKDKGGFQWCFPNLFNNCSKKIFFMSTRNMTAYWKPLPREEVCRKGMVHFYNITKFMSVQSSS